MNPLPTLVTRLVAIGLGALFSATATAAESSAHPNVLVIFADDLGYGDLGCYSATKVRTPEIDALAAAGRRFTDAHSASAVCTPSRYALLTGEYPHRKGLNVPVFLRTGLVIDPNRQTVASVMKEAGYATACIGKWHLGFGERAPDWNGVLRPGPLELGFDHYYGVPVVNSHPPFVYVEDDRVVGLVEDDPFVFGKKAKTREFFEKMGLNQIGGADAAHALYDDETVGTTLLGKAVDWIEARSEEKKPFFLYFSTTHIHHPFTPHPRFKGTSECGPYGDFIHELDWMVGELMETLEKQGLADDTLVIFTSDNGGMFNVGGQNAWDAGHRLNGELLGFKFGAWEGGHRVPFIARWPGKIEAGTESDQLISNIDLIATLSALTGIALEEGQGQDSVNILPALTGDPEAPLRDHLVLAPKERSHLSLRKGKWMYIGAQGSGGFTAAKRGAHAFGGPAAITYAGYQNSDVDGESGKIKAGAPKAQLYDLEKDLKQTKNVIREHPELAEELAGLLASYRGGGGAQRGSPEPGTRPAVGKPKEGAVTLAREGRPPNVVVFFTDDQGYNDVGCFGSPLIETPHLDQMAAEGLKLTSFYAQPVCGVSRAALLTGSYPIRVGEPGNKKHLHTVLHPKEITIPEVLREAGYATGMIGKWHLAGGGRGDSWNRELLPNAQGFDYWFGAPSHNGTTRVVPPGKGHTELMRNGKLIDPRVDQEEMGQLTKQYTEEAIGFMRRQKDKPFFLYLAHTMPHVPINASAEFLGTSKRGLYGDVITELDWSMGQVLAELKRLGLDKDTLVLFTSDNGPWVEGHLEGKGGTDSHCGSADPLRGWKMSAWEGGCRVPFIARWPGKIPAGRVSDEILTTMDFLPTFASLAGIDPPVDRTLDGFDASAFLLGETDTSPRDDYLYYSGTLLTAVREGRWKLVRPRPAKPAGTGWWGRMIEAIPDFELYDLDADPGETRNVAKQHPEVVARLEQRIEAARRELGDVDLAGSGVRLFDKGPRVLQVPVSRARGNGTVNRAATEYDGFEPVGSLRFSFESGLEGWRRTEGELAEPVTTRPALLNWKDEPFARHGDRHLSTLMVPEGKGVADSQIGVLQSPTFVLEGDRLAFLVAGGFDPETLYVALVDSETNEALIRAGGSRDHRMRRVVWDVAKWKGKTVRLEVVDRDRGGWGHLNLDDFSMKGTLMGAAASPKPSGSKPAPAATTGGEGRARVPGQKPNFIVIFTDDQGYQDLGCYGSSDIATPNLDRMAAEGMRFTSFYAQTICGPSRTALMTSSYPLRVAQVANRNETHPVVHSNEITIAEVLESQGYRSAAFGKWDLATHSQKTWIPELLPRGQGFDYFFGTPSSNDRVVHLLRNEEVIERDADMATLTQRYTDEAIRYIEENRDEPFFVYVAHTMPHTLLAASEAFKGKSKGGLYGDVIEEIDHNAGRILNTVKRLGLDENTYVIFTSDNGPWLLRKEHGGHALPLRSGKTTCWEGGMRVPCIVRAPGRVPAGTESDLVTATLDLMPTLAAIAGAELPGDRVLDGLDLSGVWHGQQDELDRPFFYYQHHYLRGVRRGDWKVMLKHEEGPGSATAKWKNHVAAKDAEPLTDHQLYHLGNDIGETTDLAAQHPDQLAALLELAEWARNDIGDFDRIGANARFFDKGPNRLGKQAVRSNSAPEGRPPARAASKSSPSQGAGRPEKPNFIVIFTDDQGYGDLGCFGGDHVETPRLDQMAAEGQKLTSFYVAAPVCTPSRAALMTGAYPKRIDMATGSDFGVLLDADPKGLNPDEITIAEVLKEAGYATGMFGKWHLGDQIEFLPTRQGFDEFFGIPYSHDIHPFHPAERWDFPPLALLDQETVIEMDPDADYLTKRFTERAVAFIEKYKDDPFFLYLPHPIPHKPLHVSPPFFKDVPADVVAKLEEEGDKIDYKTRDRLFLQAIREIDWSVGEVLDALKTHGIDENTFVIFTSDNGPAIGSAGPLRGRKGSTYEGGMREATVVRWPGKIPAGKENAQLMTAMDLLPTFARLAGAELPKDRIIDGKDVWPVLAEGQDSPHEAFFYHGGNTLRAVREGDWKLHWNKGKPTQLYHLGSDIGEQKNRIQEEPEVVKRLTERLKAFEKDIEKNSRPAAFVDDPKPLSMEREGPQASTASGAPNIIFMLTDDLGYSDIGCYGATSIQTPHLDRLAAGGMRFTNFRTAASICSPSRAAFLTGAYPQRAGVYMGLNPNREAHWFLGLHPDEITLAEHCRDQGYATHMVGKWHLGTEPEFLPRQQGFDTYYGMPCNFAHSPSFFDGDERIYERTPLDRLTELYTGRAVEIIEEAAKKDRPFFLYYAHNYPHTPYAAGEAFTGSSKDGVRGDIMQEMDWGVGEIMKALEATGIVENTLFVFTSDNGPTHNRYAQPFRGTKYVTFEGGHRVPFILHWPARIEAERVSDAPVHAMDLFPTVAAVIGAPLPGDRVYDGESLLPLLDGKPLARSAEQPFYYYNCENLQAIKRGDWKLHLPREATQVPFWEKNQAFKSLDHPVLYNLADDLGETTNVAGAHPEVVERLTRLAEDARTQLGEFMNPGSAQRPTGSLLPDFAVVSHMKDWGSAPKALTAAAMQAREERHPDAGKGKRRKAASRKQED